MKRLRIENVPLPAKSLPCMPDGEWRYRKGHRQSYGDLRAVFRKMKVGESVVYTGRHMCVHENAYRCGIEVRTRTLDGKRIPIRGLVKLRIWRIK